MVSANTVLNQALQLSREEREALVEELLRSIDSESPDSDWEAAWSAELNARLDRADRGKSTAKDWRQSIADSRRVLEEGRKS
jgi:putative addiction module component (TIGR02574 family)